MAGSLDRSLGDATKPAFGTFIVIDPNGGLIRLSGHFVLFIMGVVFLFVSALEKAVGDGWFFGGYGSASTLDVGTLIYSNGMGFALL